MAKKVPAKKHTLEMTEIFLLTMISSLLTGVVIVTFIFLIMTVQPEQVSAAYAISICVILFISIIAAMQYKNVAQ